MKSVHYKYLALIAVMAAFALLRLFQIVPNFTPMGAIALFAGVHLFKKWWAMLIPLGLLLLTDFALAGSFELYKGYHWVYLSYALFVLVGHSLGSNANPVSIGLGSLLGSVLFFLLSNFGVWYAAGLYPETFDGLMTCYTMAIPFFKNEVLGSLLFSLAIFSAFEALKNWIPAIGREAV